MASTVVGELLQLADRQRIRTERIIVATKLVLARLWRQLDPAALTPSWDAEIGRRALVAVSGAQLAAAQGATPYVRAAMALQDLDPDNAQGTLVPEALAGMASDGRSLSSLLYQPIIGVKTQLADGATLDEAMRIGLGAVERIVETQIADAARVGTGVASNAHKQIQWYVRVLTPPSCGRCAILAGKVTSVEKAFSRHPRCLLAGSVVSGPATLAATRRWFEGELVIIRTAGGKQLPITGNHPVLTDRGWVPAHLVEEGDHCVRSILDQGATPLVVPDEHQVPTPIEDVWGAHRVAGFRAMPTTAEDFHGDGGHGEVHVVAANSDLRDRFNATLAQPAGQPSLSGRGELANTLESQRVPLLDLFGLRDATDGIMSSPSLLGAFLGGHLPSADQAGFTAPTDRHTCDLQYAPDDVARDAVLLRQGVLADTVEVGHNDVAFGQDISASRWDAPASQFTVEGGVAYASRGLDLLHRLAGQVELDRVVEARRVSWAGHVYNLTSIEGWFAADTLIVSNCDCQNLALGDKRLANQMIRDPKEYFDSLSAAEQRRIFTKAGAAAINDGADIFQVVNARRGMSTTGSWVERLPGPELAGRTDLRVTHRGRVTSGQFTTEGMTRRGLASQGLRRTPGARRLTPEAIYALASDRDEILRLLRRFGYLT